MSALVDRIIPPVQTVDDAGKVKPSRQQPDEQLATVALGAVNLVICVGLVVVHSRVGPADLSNSSKLLLLGLGCLVSVATLPAARYGNRLVAGLVVLGAGFLGPATLLGIFYIAPHYALAMWMIFRQNKLARVQAEERRKARLAGGGGKPASPRGRGGRSDRTPKLPDGRPAPPPSKRYTPPRPKKKPIPKPVDTSKVDAAKAEAD